VATTYFVCGSPRAGASLLAGLLKTTGVAGRPEEYFWRDDMPTWSARWNVSTFGQYLAAALREGTTPNGVFGAKVMWGYLTDFLGRLRVLAGHAEPSDRLLIERFFPDCRFVWIWREDVVAQGVSWARAVQTNVWYDHVGQQPTREPVFDFEQIDSLVRAASAHTQAWQDWFAANAVEPFAVRFEDLVLDKAGITRQILHFLGLEPADGLAIAEQTRRQGDVLNEVWIERYRELVGQHKLSK
jgi:trehalose 2-sulfotransferase